MKYIATVVLGLVLWPATPAHSQGNDWEQQIRAAEQRHVKAFLARDTAALDSMFPDDFVVNSPQNRVVGKAELMTMVKRGVLSLSGFEQKIEQIRRFGDVVTVMGEDKVTFAAPSPMAGQTQKRRFSDIWQFRGKNWSFIARQATIVK
jgi:ketosteroid isomerase-like protein